MKASLVSKVRKLGFSKSMAFTDWSDHWDFSTFRLLMTFQIFYDLDKSITILSALSLSPSISLFSVLNISGADNLDNLVVFNIEVNGAAILLQPKIKR